LTKVNDYLTKRQVTYVQLTSNTHYNKNKDIKSREPHYDFLPKV